MDTPIDFKSSPDPIVIQSDQVFIPDMPNVDFGGGDGGGAGASGSWDAPDMSSSTNDTSSFNSD